MKLNVKKRQYSGRRQKRLHDLSTWSNASHIMLLRQRALARVFVQGAQRWPVFYAFDEAIRFCVKAYNSSVSYILLGGGRERCACPHRGDMPSKEAHFASLTSKSAVAKSKSASEMCAGQSAPQSPTGWPAKRCTWSPCLMGRARAASAKLPGSLASNNERVWCRHDPAGSSIN